MRGTTQDHPAVPLQHGGRWTIALLVSFDAASDSSNKASAMNTAQVDHHLMTHSDQMCQPQWVRRRWHREEALARLKDLAKLLQRENGSCDCHRGVWVWGACSDQDQVRNRAQGMAPDWGLEFPRPRHDRPCSPDRHGHGRRQGVRHLMWNGPMGACSDEDRARNRAQGMALDWGLE